jgi:hypothetical protein
MPPKTGRKNHMNIRLETPVRKKIVSLLLALCMVMGFLPGMEMRAEAAEANSDVLFFDDITGYFYVDGAFQTPYLEQQDHYEWDGETKTLTLKSFVYETSARIGLEMQNMTATAFNLVLEGENSFISSSSDGAPVGVNFFSKNVTISGTGSLLASATTDSASVIDAAGIGLGTTGQLNLTSGTVTATADITNASGRAIGINSNGNQIHISGGTLTAQGTGGASRYATVGINNNGVITPTVDYTYSAGTASDSLSITNEKLTSGTGTVDLVTAVHAYAKIDAAPTVTGFSASGLTASGAVLNFTSSEAGKYYYLIQTQGTDDPANAAAVKSGATNGGGQTFTAVGENVAFRAEGLTTGTYEAFITVEDSAGNLSAMQTISSIEIPSRSAAMSAITVSGTVGDTVSSTATITLTGDTLVSALEDADVTSWFSNAPSGMTITARSADTVITLTFSGTPTTVSDAIMAITIPDTALSGSGDLVVSTSTLTRFAITDGTAPTPGNTGIVTSSNVTERSATLNWAKATDNISLAANLKYYIYYSTSANMGTVGNVETNGTLLNPSGTADINSYALLDFFTPGTTYYFTVVVTDQAGNKAVYDTADITTVALPEINYNAADIAAINTLINDANLTGLDWALASDTEAPINAVPADWADGVAWSDDGRVTALSFTGLIGTLTIDAGSLDGGLTELSFVNISNNTGLTSATIKGFSKLEDFNVNGCTSLTTLDVSNNSILYLYIADLSALETLTGTGQARTIPMAGDQSPWTASVHFANGNGSDATLGNVSFSDDGGELSYAKGDYYWDGGTLSSTSSSATNVGFTAPTHLADIDPLSGTLTLVYTAGTAISAAAITGIDAPVANNTPDTDGTNSGDFTVDSISWSPTPTFNTSNFDYGREYTATITLAAADGKAFPGTFNSTSEIAGFTVNSIAPTFVSRANDGSQLVLSVKFPATALCSDATISGGSLAGVALVGTFTGGVDIANSQALTVSIPYASRTDAALLLTKGDSNAVVKYVKSSLQPSGNSVYATTYNGTNTITVADNDVIWLLVTAQDGTTQKYYKITVTVESVSVTFSNLTANGESNTTTTTQLTITLSSDINLVANDVEVTGATKGDLTDNNSGTYTLAISNITVANGADVTVALSKSGYAFSPSSKDVAVYKAPATYTVTLTVNKDGGDYDAHVKTFTLKQEAVTKYTGSGTDETVTFSGVLAGTYDLYDGANDTGTDIVVDGAETATLNYYTVAFTVANIGTATGSTISATYNGVGIASGTVVLAGDELVITASGAGSTSYAYAWTGTGTNSQITAALTISDLAGMVNATCTITGTGSNEADETPPTISSFAPTGASVAINANEISLQFNESMDTAAGSVTLTYGAGQSVSLLGGGWDQTSVANDTYTIAIDDTLAYSTTYTIVITGFQDVAGNAYVGGNKTFTTVDPATTAPTITTNSLSGGTVSTAYSATLAATGTTPITWSVTTGNLPDGLSLDSSTGVISGTPTAANTFAFTVQAANGTLPNDTQDLSITIAAAPTAPTITTHSLSGGTVGTAYSATLAATGTTPITWSVTTGSLPDGLSLSSSTGVISGTPTAANTFTFTVQVANGTLPNDTQELSITIAPIPAAPTYAVTVTNGTGGGNYAQGASVSISANTPAEGYQFSHWTATPAVTFADAYASSTTFPMIAQPVTITAMYTVIPVDPAVSPASLTMTAGESKTLHISLGTSYTGATISSSDLAAATVSPASVSADGDVQVYGVAAGNVVITVTFTGGTPAYSVVVPVIVSTAQLPPADPIYPPTPTTPTYPDTGDSSSGGGSTSSEPAPSNAPSPVTPQEAAQSAQAAVAAAIAAGSNSANVKIQNPTTIGQEALEAIADAAASLPGGAKLMGDSMSADGKSVDVRIKIDVKAAIDSLLSGAIKTLNLAASTTSKAAEQVETFFEKWFENEMSNLHFEMTGSWGQPVEVAAKLDPNLDPANLFFYAYDKATNTYTRIQNPNAWVDKNGYVHFTTEVAGDIIISEGELVRR